ncbi:MAG TPA: glycosyl hydrolase family 28-related protein [Polyangiaceae bacterium]|jgi:MYXO-CTERM domain-containing protein
MRKPIALLVAASTFLLSLAARADLIVPPTVSQGHAQDPLVHAGFLDATIYGADPTGQKDSTKAIQAAIDDGRDYLMTTYLPPGTYLISDTLTGAEDGNGSGESYCFQLAAKNGSAYDDEWVNAQAPTLVGPPSGPRAVLKLADSAAGFGDASSPKPAVHFVDDGPAAQYVNATVGAADCLMYAVIRDVDLDLGTGNAGAIGVQFFSAQYSYMANVSVHAGGGYAGIEGAPATSDWVNLSVDGGQYGILMDNGGTSSLAGITLTNQSKAGLSLSADGAVAIAGFHIAETTGSGVVMAPFNGVPQLASVVLLDGDVTMGAGASPAIANPDGIDLVVQNVWVQTPGALVESGTQAGGAVAGSGSMDLVTEYAYTNTAVTGADYAPNTSYDLIDGTMGQKGLTKVQPKAGAPPGDLVIRHLPGPLPWFTDPGVVDATTAGADPTGNTDATAALQKAIDQSEGHGDAVFLPRGNYLVSGTLTLHPDTRLFGVPGPKSTLWASTWAPSGTFAPFVQTADTATGKTFVGDLQIVLPNDDEDGIGYAQSYLSAFDWRAGRSSVLYHANVNLEPDWSTTSQSATAGRSLVHVEGNGGGKFYGLQQAASGDNTRVANPAFRFLLVDGTTTPLTLYGPNFEHGEGDDFVEITKASNVRVLETKTECRVTWAAVESSQNVLIAGVGGDWAPSAVGVSSTDSSNVEAAALGWYADEGNASAWYVYRSGGTEPDAGVTYANAVSLFQDGTFDDTPFPHCGDGVCDGAETSANCAQDCGTAGASDAGSGADGGRGVDAGPAGGEPGVDAGTGTRAPGSADGGTANGAAPGGSSGGCGCTVGDESGSGMAPLLGLVVGCALLAKRRRASSRRKAA